MNKKIVNVVFYKFWDPTREDAMQQACIFYEDGSVKNTTHEEGLEAAYTIANAEKLTGQQFRAMLNKDKVYTMSGTDFERRFQEFIRVSPENVAAAVNAEMVKIAPSRMNGAVKQKVYQSQQPTNNSKLEGYLRDQQEAADRIYSVQAERLRRLREEAASQNSSPRVLQELDEAEAEMQKTQAEIAMKVQQILREEQARNAAKNTQTPSQQPVNNGASAIPTPIAIPTTQQQSQQSQNNGYTSQQQPANNQTRHSNIPVVPIVIPASGSQTTSATPIQNPTRGQTSSQQRPAQGTQPTPTTPTSATATPAQPPKKQSLWQRFKKSKVGKKVVALAVAASLLVGGTAAGYHLGKNSKSGQILNNNIALQQIDENTVEAQDATYINLLNETKNEDLKAIMTKQGQNLDMYNRDFAAAYVETGKDVKAALSWDEVIALNLAYNDYSKEQIELMFNGSEVDSLALSHAYKNAQLQLMGAYVISDRETPVNMAAFINSDEGKAFVQKYEDLFYACKEATGDERVAAVNTFYQELFKDFPISDEVREEGLSHADSRKSVKNYMAAVAPMVAASEIMWQNLSIDHTLSDKATAYFNDIGLCNIAEDAFERAETITLMAETNDDVPTYQEFMNAKITELMIEGNYVIDDAHRDLSQLDEFQKWVNGHFVFDANGYNTGVITRTTTSTHTETTYSTETKTHTTSDRDEAVRAAGEQAVKDAENKVNQQIDKENAAAKAEAEKEAEKNRQEMQEQADKESERLEEEVKQDDQDFQDNIDDANNNINNGGTVNEDDLGHGTDFDDDHSNGNGDLNDSVGDITTDGSGAVDHDDPLPDPNETGQSFDNSSQSSGTSEEYFDEGLDSYEEPYTVSSNAEIVNRMLQEMETQSTASTSAKVYTYTA